MCSSLICENTYLELIELISEYKPTWLNIQPSVLSNLIFYYKHYNAVPPKSITYIECVGEMLSKATRSQSEAMFNATVANMYGSEEMNAIAFECPYHNMHIIENNVLVECLGDNGAINSLGKGESIITNLNNFAMPLIRYNLGDYIKIEPTNICKCGNTSKTIDNIIGRVRENITINGIVLNSFNLTRIVNAINNEMGDPIIEYRFDFYLSRNILVCTFRINKAYEGWKNKLRLLFKNHLKNYIGIEMSIQFVFTFNKIESQSGHKLGLLISHE